MLHFLGHFICIFGIRVGEVKANTLVMMEVTKDRITGMEKLKLIQI